MTKTDFVSLMTTDLPDQPAYFSRDAEINRTGATALDDMAEERHFIQPKLTFAELSVELMFS